MVKNILLKLFFIFSITCALAQNIPTNLDRNTLEKAVKIYTEVLNRENNSTVEVELAEVLYLLGKHRESARYYSKVINREDILPIHYRIYSRVLEKLGKSDSAAYFEKKYKKYEFEALLLPRDLQILTGFSNDTISFFVNKVPFNSNDADFSPVVFDTSLIFVSTRKHNNDLNIHLWTGESYYDLYKVNFLKEGEFTKPEKLIYENLDHNVAEGPICFSSDRRTIYFNRNFLDAQSYTGPEGQLVDKLHIMQGKLEGMKITDIKPFEFNSYQFSSTQPYITRDGKELFFVANDPEGHGGFDIYVSKKSADGKWRKPENLGRTINTEMDELYPFLDQNENLYFASEGHLGLGGMDIFVSRRTANGWSEPLNLGTPFNSHYDDFGVYFKNDLKSGFFSSNRPGGDGSDDIYSFEMVFDSPKEKKEALEIFVGKINQSKFENNKGLEIMGEIMDKDSHKPLEDIWVILKDQYKNEVRQAVTDENGKYKFKYLTPGNYIIEFEKKPTNEMSSFKTQPADTVYTFTPEYVQNYKLAEVSLDAQKIGNKNILLGLVTTSGSNKLNDIDIFLVDKSGKIRNHTEVNNEGYFAFKDLKTMEYFIVMKEQIPNLAVTTYLCNIDSNLTISKSEIIKKEEGYDNIFPTYADSVNAIIVGGVNSDISQKVLNNIPIFLASANLKTINSSYSNNGGYFVFTNLKKNNDVIFNEASNRGLLTKHVITLDYNLKNHKVIHSQILDFKKLKGKIEKEEKLVINGKVKSLQNKGIVANKYILVLDSTNNIINRVRSNEEGYFVVNDLSYDNTYKFIFEDYEPLLSVQLNLSYIDLDLQEYYGKLSSYKYAELKGLNKEAQEVNINCKAFYNKDRRPAENVAFFVVGENGKIIKRLTTNKDGAFYFYKKQVGDYYILQESIDTSITVTMNSKRKSYSKLKSNIEIAGSKNFQLFNSVYFGLGNADLNDYAKNVLNSFQNYMKDNNIKKVVLNGYGDLSGSADKNLLITSKRTQTCKDFLDFKGIDHKKIELKALGKTDKFKNENNEYDPALNRKVDILFLE